jgi:hypothetical protein
VIQWRGSTLDEEYVGPSKRGSLGTRLRSFRSQASPVRCGHIARCCTLYSRLLTPIACDECFVRQLHGVRMHTCPYKLKVRVKEPRLCALLTQDLADGSKNFFVLLLVYMTAMAAQPPCPAGSVGWRRRLSSLMVLRSSLLVRIRMERCFVSMRGQPGEAGP